MSDQPTEQHATPVAAAREPYAAGEEADGWFEEQELPPRRARRRLLTPLPVTLLCILLAACGFIAGALVQKGQEGTSTATGGSGLASRFAALRSAGATRAGAGAAGGAAFGAGGAGATIGQVAFVEGSTLYVTDSAGNTVKVRTSAASTVTKTVSSSLHAIHPGEEVVITGPSGASGTVTAESIRVGATTAGGGLGGLFGAGAGAATATGGSGASSSGGPSLFGGG